MAVVLLSCLAGCGRMPGQSGSVEIVATVFPAYDFARALTKDVEGVSVRMLLSPGTESHTFDPSAGDAIALSECGLFVYAGGDADPWVEKFFNADKTLESRSVSMSGAVPEKLVIEGEDEDDPHVWTSPKNAVEILQTIEDRILDLPEIRADEGKAAQIRDNYDAYKAELEKLDKDFRDLAAAIPEAKRTLAFGDRYPFRYFCAEYGFTAVAVFPGCAEESEPAASDVKHVIDTIREKELDTVYYVELSNHRIADTIAAETGATTACLHSCHNLSKADFDAGETYLSLMRRNYETLKALAAVEDN
jgi:zinc transport system substrate-binding protein